MVTAWQRGLPSAHPVPRCQGRAHLLRALPPSTLTAAAFTGEETRAWPSGEEPRLGQVPSSGPLDPPLLLLCGVSPSAFPTPSTVCSPRTWETAF